VVVRDVPTPWARKGAVMRHVGAAASGGAVVLLDGVKVMEGDRWALVIPYADEPLCRVWAEGPTAAEARAMADRYATLAAEAAAGEPVAESTE
jgi:mannose-1-phosphate guanylyltransferase/phosphomannomutase